MKASLIAFRWEREDMILARDLLSNVIEAKDKKDQMLAEFNIGLFNEVLSKVARIVGERELHS